MHAGVPGCPRPGHGGDGWTVVLDGVQRRGGRERQRFRCRNPAGEYHRFLGASARTRTDKTMCDGCDSHIRPHQGPVSPWRFEYLTREVAEALVAVGNGLTYTEAAHLARTSANKGRTVEAAIQANGQTVAEWMVDLAPVVTGPYRETRWPDDTLVLDETEFRWRNPRTGVRIRLFSVFAAWGYTAAGESRLWALKASPRDDIPAWQGFLASLPGQPRSVVSDRDSGIIGGVQAHWQSAVPHHQCEWHLEFNALKRLHADGADGNQILTGLLATAFQTARGWLAFRREVLANPNLKNTQQWVNYWDQDMRIQIGRRASLPAHYSAAAAEIPLRIVRQVLERRAWTFRNLERMNLLLELVRMRILGTADPRQYAERIRVHLDAHGGHMPRRYRQIVDPVQPHPITGVPVRTASLRP